MSDGSGELLPPPAPPTPEPRRGQRDVVCQFCECRLTSTGDVLRLSDRAKALRDFEDDLEEARRDCNEARAAAEAATTEAQSLRTTISKLEADLKKAKTVW